MVVCNASHVARGGAHVDEVAAPLEDHRATIAIHTSHHVRMLTLIRDQWHEIEKGPPQHIA